MSLSLRTVLIAALALGGAVTVQPEPAAAQVYQGIPVYDGGRLRYRPGPRIDGPYARAYRGFYGPRYRGYRPAYYGRRYYGYRPAYYGRRYYGYPYRYYRRSSNGGAVAAGLVGGLALGAIASAASNPYYYRPAYYRPARTCFTERRRIVNRYGRVVVRRVQTCY